MNISSSLDKKLARRFKTYDHDGNGYIEKADFEQFVAALCAEFGHATGTPAYQQLYGCAMPVWQHLVAAADANADGQISESEYKHSFANGLLDTPTFFDQVYTPFNEAIIAIIDADGDGKINIEEEVRYKRVTMNVAEADVRAAFQEIDTDGDGYITIAEKLASIRHYYLNNDLQPGISRLLGSLDA